LAGAFERESFDAVVLDCDQSDSNGIELLGQLREHLPATVAVVLCSERAEERDIAAALHAGAADYIIKPLRRTLLMARLAAVVRRGVQDPARSDQVDIGEFRIDCRERTVLRNSAAVELTAKDFDLTVLFLRNVGRLLSREYIHEVVWKSEPVLGSRAVDTRVSRIRNKLTLVPEHGWRLVAVYGHGYRLLRLRMPEQPAVTEIATPRATTPAPVLPVQPAAPSPA
jgi:DNA-binding response OmpR family regulator